LPYNRGKKHGKTAVRVVENSPDIPVAAVQYTFTHKQYTEQHDETEYTKGTYITERGTYIKIRTYIIIILENIRYKEFRHFSSPLKLTM
jgi:hypothetical protein